MRNSAVEFKHGKLVAGEVNYIHRVTVPAGEYEVGDMIFTTDGISYAKSGELENPFEAEYAIVAQAVTLEEQGEVVCYKEGYFNVNVVKFNGKSLSEVWDEGGETVSQILKTKRIFITNVKED